jgi:hypothetical protein
MEALSSNASFTWFVVVVMNFEGKMCAEALQSPASELDTI